jgi:hypothetical protein
LVREANQTYQAARGQFQDHQKAHNCCKAIHFEDEASDNAIIARCILQAGSRSFAAS